MGLGLVVGVAALGVISARSVVERRQQIGVLRSIGFKRGMVQLSFLLESSFVALLGIAVGCALGLILSFNIVRDNAQQASTENIEFAVPWINLTAIFVIAYAASLLTTFLPARQASRVYPAEALRYE
jgi:putative ABC transport system permease protein